MTKQKQIEFPPKQGLVVTQFLTVADVKRAAAFYGDVLGGTIIHQNGPTIVQLANSWIILNVGGGPTDDKPTVTLKRPDHLDEVSAFLNIRAADIHDCYERWRSRGAHFLTEPKDHGSEIRCYMRDPDGYLIEVGQTQERNERRQRSADRRARRRSRARGTDDCPIITFARPRGHRR